MNTRTGMFLPLLFGCHSLVCGPGTIERDGQCLPDLTGDGGAPDTSTDSDGGGGDTAATDGPDSGGSDDGGPDSGDDGDSGDAARPVQVYVLGGQSNMVGIGQVTGLPPSWREQQPDVQIWSSGWPSWRPLQPSSDYTSSSAVYTGPEVSMGRWLADLHPDDEIVLVKHAVGGTDLASYWYPGESRDDPSQGLGYQTWLATIDAATAELDAQGTAWEFAGMAWMQGESDAIYDSWSSAYQDNLTHFVDRVRDDLDTDSLPFVLGLIDCEGACTYRTRVREAQQAVADADDAVFAVETEDLGLYPTDWWHYQGVGIRVMGARFAQALAGASDLLPFPTAAVEVGETFSYSYYGSYTVGWRFTLDTAVMVTDLGIFDVGADGLAATAEVVIWDVDTETILLSETVPSNAAGPTPIYGWFRYAATEPTLLEAGDYVIVNQAFSSNWDYYTYGAAITTSAPVAWTEYRHGVGTGLVFPTQSGGGTEASAAWFGPGFMYQGVDEGL